MSVQDLEVVNDYNIKCGGFRLITNPVNEYVLTSDSQGNGTWQPNGASEEGPTGATGPQGSTGPIGSTGPQGATGPQGTPSATLGAYVYAVSQTQQSITQTPTLLSIDAVLNRSTSPFWFVASGNTLQCPVAGTYVIQVTVELNCDSVGNGVNLQILRNGSQVGIPGNNFYLRQVTNTSGSFKMCNQIFGSIIADLNLNDNITFSCASADNTGTFYTYPYTNAGVTGSGYSATYQIIRLK